MPICGGLSNADKPADAEVQGLVDKVKSEVTGKMNANFNVFEAVSYRTQVVAGVNYFIKIHVGDGNHIHVRVYKNLQQELSVHSVQDGKTREDPLEYF